MTQFLIGICFHEPEPFARWRRGLIADYESSTGLWVVADTPEQAVAWAERVGEALHRVVNNDPLADWASEYCCWLEESPAESGWAHCLDFFQCVRVGEMPALERMSTEAYNQWQRGRA